MVSDFQRLPSQDEIMRYDPRWISDMQLAHRIYSFYGNRSPLFQILEQDGKDADGFTDYKQGMSKEEWAAYNWKTFMDNVDMQSLSEMNDTGL